jgi:hypothetical protein
LTVRHVRVVPSTAFQSLTWTCTAEFAAHEAAPACEGAPEPVLLLPEKTVPTPPCAVQTVAENPHQAMPVEAIAVRETVMPVAVAPDCAGPASSRRTGSRSPRLAGWLAVSR